MKIVCVVVSCVETTTQSSQAIASGRSGDPVSAVEISRPANRSVTDGSSPAKRLESQSWLWPSIETAYTPDLSTTAWQYDCLFKQTRTVGGSSETDVKLLTVIPAYSPSATVVTTVTPVAHWRIVARSTFESIAIWTIFLHFRRVTTLNILLAANRL